LWFYAFADYVFPPPHQKIKKEKRKKKRKERNINICKSQMLWPSEFLNWVRVTWLKILLHLTKLPKQWKSMNVHGQFWLFFSKKSGIKFTLWTVLSFCQIYQIRHSYNVRPIVASLFFSITSNFQTILKKTLFYFNKIKGTLSFSLKFGWFSCNFQENKIHVLFIKEITKCIKYLLKSK
jgi:hypothetical protein